MSYNMGPVRIPAPPRTQGLRLVGLGLRASARAGATQLTALLASCRAGVRTLAIVVLSYLVAVSIGLMVLVGAGIGTALELPAGIVAAVVVAGYAVVLDRIYAR